MRFFPAVAVLGIACSGTTPSVAPDRAPNPVLTTQRSGTSNLLQAVSVVSEDVVWVSGHGGTYAITVDGGESWVAGQVRDADTMQFRDVHAFSADHAYLLGAGPGEMSRIYMTIDGGRTWDLQWVNSEDRGFYDCFDFWDENTAVAYGDAIDGELRMVRTTDGETWFVVSQENLPQGRDGEGGFAASGTCLVTLAPSSGWVGTGAGSARVLRTGDRGATWTAAATPIVSNAPASGITSLAFWGEDTGMAFGGDLAITDLYTDNVAVTIDGGGTWRLASHPVFFGGIYGSAYVPGTPHPAVVVVGPNGADFTLDVGGTWSSLDTLSYWAVGFAGPSAGWAVGPGGRITKISLF
jgi:photosystem II stability/assembly factor-like uncharacterized protein